MSQPGFGASPGCYTQVWIGYAGFALLVAGLLAIAGALLLVRREGRARAAGLAARPNRYLGTPGQRTGAAAEQPDPAIVRPLRAEEPPASAPQQPSTAA